MAMRHEDGSWSGLPTYRDDPTPVSREFLLVIVPDDCEPAEFYETVTQHEFPEIGRHFSDDQQWQYVVDDGLEHEDYTSEVFFELAREVEGIGLYEVEVPTNSYFPERTALMLAKGKAFDDSWSLPCRHFFLEIVGGKFREAAA